MPVRRRDILVLLGGAVVTRPLAARAQQKPMLVIGYLSSGSPGPAAPTVAAFRQGLGETSYVEGQSVAIDYRWAEGRYDRLPALAADLVDRNVDLIVAAAGNESALAAKGATSAIPIVFTASATRSTVALSPVSPGREATSRVSPSYPPPI
jgi:putative tryptophan/tyrosine transport system substrate-binding protein